MLESGEGLQMMVLLRMNATSVIGTIIGGGGTQTLLTVKFVFKFYTLSGSGDARTSGVSPPYFVIAFYSPRTELGISLQTSSDQKKNHAKY